MSLYVLKPDKSPGQTLLYVSIPHSELLFEAWRTKNSYTRKTGHQISLKAFQDFNMFNTYIFKIH